MKKLIVLSLMLLMHASCQAELKLPNIFGNHMVVQQKAPIKVWGLTVPGQKVTAELGGQSASTTADAEGKFVLAIPELTAGGPHTLTITADETKTFQDVLVGEVWICSGQSNMQWSVNAANDADLERLAAKHPNLRMINFPQVGVQEPIWTHDDRQWQVCTPETVGGFSAVGYFFGRQLLDTLDVPVGMINN
ncbi:MAG: carboxypeptidase regulatory-like domain-containing protein, partial [Planctomycetales bacterium]|nr:carboxypeptidase regulatory-like domain-containing protein [Planctomycetales bacterium]